MSLFPQGCLRLARGLLDEAGRLRVRLATAESCTGGLIAGCLTEIAGSSAVVDRGYVVYDNRAKIEMLGVREATLAEHGAVSEETAREIDEAVRALVSRAFERSVQILIEKRAVLEKTARELLLKETLNEEDLRKVREQLAVPAAPAAAA